MLACDAKQKVLRVRTGRTGGQMDKWENTRRGKKTKHTNPKQATVEVIILILSVVQFLSL